MKKNQNSKPAESKMKIAGNTIGLLVETRYAPLFKKEGWAIKYNGQTNSILKKDMVNALILSGLNEKTVNKTFNTLTDCGHLRHMNPDGGSIIAYPLNNPAFKVVLASFEDKTQSSRLRGSCGQANDLIAGPANFLNEWSKFTTGNRVVPTIVVAHGADYDGTKKYNISRLKDILMVEPNISPYNSEAMLLGPKAWLWVGKDFSTQEYTKMLYESTTKNIEVFLNHVLPWLKIDLTYFKKDNDTYYSHCNML